MNLRIKHLIKLTWIKIKNYLQEGEQEDKSEWFLQHPFASASLPVVPRLFCSATSTISLTLHLYSHMDPTNGTMTKRDRSMITVQWVTQKTVISYLPYLTGIRMGNTNAENIVVMEKHIILSLQLNLLYTQSCGCAWNVKIMDSLLLSVEKTKSEVAV